MNKILKTSVTALVMLLAIVTVSSISPAFASTVTFTQVSTPFNTPIGIDHFAPTNEVVISVNYASGLPHNFERVSSTGAHTQFSILSGFTDEVKIATAKDDGGGMSMGGFLPGTLFTGNGVDGQIAKINPDATFANPWVSLPGSGNGLMRGSLYVDRTGVYGGDLIVATTAGEVWRINSAGTPMKLADVNVHLEGLLTVPADPTKYGPLAGKIIAGAENQGLLYAFDNTGFVSTHDVNVNVEDIDLIPVNANFFGVNFGTGKILGAPASEFTPFAGDILLTQEFHPGSSGLFRLFWNGVSLAAPQFTIGAGSDPVGQWEHVTFSTAGIVEIPPVEICDNGIDDDGDGQVDEGCNTAPVANNDGVSTLEDTPVDGTATATDAENDLLTFMLVSGTSNGGLLFNPDGTFTYTPNADFFGTDSFTFKADDGKVDSNVAMITIDVIPVNDPPVCSAATADTTVLWPPNHKMKKVTVSLTATDVDGDTPSIGISGITQDEPTNGLGDGDNSPDANILSSNEVELREERSGTGDGRVYRLSVTADDGNGGTCTGVVMVIVPHDQSPPIAAVDSGDTFDSTAP